MRLLQVMAGAEHGGAETFFVSLALALARAGLEQRVAIRRNPARAAALRAGGLEPLELRFGGPLDRLTPWRLKRLAAAFRPDIVLCWMSRAAAVMPSGPWLKLARIGGYYDLKYFRSCDQLLCITPQLVERYAALGWPRERLHFMPNFSTFEDEPAVPRSAFGTPEGAPLLLSLGRLHPAKALDTLLHALAREPRAHLWLAGEGPSRGELESLSAELGLTERVRFLGWRSDKTALLKACDLCVFPSRSEAFGSVIVEAWAHRRPLVAAAADGPKAFVEDGRTGLLVPIDDVGALAGAITRLIDEPALAASLVEAGYRRYREEFTESACVARYLGLFERLLAEAPPRRAGRS
ncbi:Glycosyltransferase involved in cell wall bisynthesis [Tistlia consotensis]|uniref:Glycosyltransferase involved in cell wall bisynthesis n=1 Tax=Tistlia consotensis USBA 355 TaxID=560819 RepID=A0A1Y6BTU4_9PROT|nr:glycosyltransferase [Tistlia consotensis]SMF24918.1 Glycosyltransferase involved in cell wall bisynthesis [Tistlia consotensis USBA 355]SNR60288.1 Glycosyltransferase involved in cell wall bisynthesis [Tistlia consotensis]